LELAHGVTNSYHLPLRFWQWPDFGLYFLVHALGPGLTWPLAAAALAGIAIALRRFRADPAVGTVAVLSLLWYAAAELASLKVIVDTERYTMPCVPLWAVFAAIFFTRWGHAALPLRRSGGVRWGRGLPILLLCYALGRSLVLSYGIVPDTRVLADQWLAENLRPRGRSNALRRIGYFHGDPYRPTAFRSRMRIISKGLWLTDPEQERNRLLASVDGFTLSSFWTTRYARTRRLAFSRDALERFARIRREFPYCHVIEKRACFRSGFHNPKIEIRLKRAPPLVQPPAGVPAPGAE
jgi:hypothetical protein